MYLNKQTSVLKILRAFNAGVINRTSKKCKCSEDDLLLSAQEAARSLMGFVPQTKDLPGLSRSDKETKDIKGELATQEKQSQVNQAASLIPVNNANIILRSSPDKNFSDYDLERMVITHNFYEKNINQNGFFSKQYDPVDDQPFVSDTRTSLMWQRDGSSSKVNWDKAIRYIERLNQDRFAGYSDWRLPTIEELASLLERQNNNGFYIHPIFSTTQTRCWSIDVADSPQYREGILTSRWVVDFSSGSITKATWYLSSSSLRWNPINSENFVRGVRSP